MSFRLVDMLFLWLLEFYYKFLVCNMKKILLFMMFALLLVTT